MPDGQGGGTIDDLMGDLAGEGEEGAPERKGEGLHDQVERGKKAYEKAKGEKGEEGKEGEKEKPGPKGAEEGTAEAGAPEAGAGAGEAGAEAGAGEAAAAGAEAAPGAQAAGAGAMAGEAGAAGAETAGAGAAAAGGEAAGAAGSAAAGAATAGAETAATGTAAAGAGAATAGIGAAIVLAAAAVSHWANKHGGLLKWILIIFAIIAMVIFLIFGGLASYHLSGGAGKSAPQPAGTSSQNVKKMETQNQNPAKTGPPESPFQNPVSGFNQIVYKDAKDKDYVSSGEIDDRLARALAYLAEKHGVLRISHIISDYEYMNVSEAGKDTNPQVIENISAHQDGLAADIDYIDFVYKVIEENSACGTAADIISGGDVPVGDIVYYNDLNEELLRLPCADIGGRSALPNTSWNNLPAEAIPIKILYQDPKPNIEHAGNEPDPSLTTDPIEKMVYEKVYQPEARRKVHLVAQELLEFPYATDDADFYRITQLITYSKERDVQSFMDDGTLDKLYGLPRAANYGLFYMLESWQNIHIGY